jgi:hypothetical protein
MGIGGRRSRRWTGRQGLRVRELGLPRFLSRLSTGSWPVGCVAVGLALGLVPGRCWLFRVEWVLRVPRVNTRLGPNLVRVFSFVTR